MKLTDLYYLTDPEIRIILFQCKKTDLMKASLVMPDELFQKLMPFFSNEIRTEFNNYKKKTSTVSMHEINEAQDRIVSEMKRLLTL